MALTKLLIQDPGPCGGPYMARQKSDGWSLHWRAGPDDDRISHCRCLRVSSGVCPSRTGSTLWLLAFGKLWMLLGVFSVADLGKAAKQPEAKRIHKRAFQKPFHEDSLVNCHLAIDRECSGLSAGSLASLPYGPGLTELALQPLIGLEPFRRQDEAEANDGWVSLLEPQCNSLLLGHEHASPATLQHRWKGKTPMPIKEDSAL